MTGRESVSILKKVSSQKLTNTVASNKVEYVPQKEIFERLKEEIKGGEIVLVMGAGNIYDLSKKLAKKS